MEHKEAISTADLSKINEYFSNVLESGDAVKLSQYCWFNLSLHFALRGAEIEIKLLKMDIVLTTVFVSFLTAAFYHLTKKTKF